MLWKGALAIGGETAIAMAIVANTFGLCIVMHY